MSTSEYIEGMLVAEKLTGKSDAYLKNLLTNEKRKELIQKTIDDIQSKINEEADAGGYIISHELFLFDSDEPGPTSKNFAHKEIFDIIRNFEDKKYLVDWHSESYDTTRFRNRDKVKYVFQICWYDIKE